ncbi:MAG: hypothetical protein ACC662_06390, partial [Planctomycetota bacterium]
MSDLPPRPGFLTLLGVLGLAILVAAPAALAGDDEPQGASKKSEGTSATVVVTTKDGRKTVRIVRGATWLPKGDGDQGATTSVRIVVPDGQLPAMRGGKSPLPTVFRWLVKTRRKVMSGPNPLEAWFTGGDDVPLAGLRDALAEDGWNAGSLTKWIQTKVGPRWKVMLGAASGVRGAGLGGPGASSGPHGRGAGAGNSCDPGARCEKARGHGPRGHGTSGHHGGGRRGEGRCGEGRRGGGCGDGGHGDRMRMQRGQGRRKACDGCPHARRGRRSPGRWAHGGRSRWARGPAERARPGRGGLVLGRGAAGQGGGSRFVGPGALTRTIILWNDGSGWRRRELSGYSAPRTTAAGMSCGGKAGDGARGEAGKKCEGMGKGSCGKAGNGARGEAGEKCEGMGKGSCGKAGNGARGEAGEKCEGM